MNNRGTQGLFVFLAIVILVLVWLYISGKVASAAEDNLENNTKSTKDLLMGYAESIAISPPTCEKLGGNVCIRNETECGKYCKTVKSMKGGFCSSARSSCISGAPCCCVCN